MRVALLSVSRIVVFINQEALSQGRVQCLTLTDADYNFDANLQMYIKKKAPCLYDGPPNIPDGVYHQRNKRVPPEQSPNDTQLQEHRVFAEPSEPRNVIGKEMPEDPEERRQHERRMYDN